MPPEDRPPSADDLLAALAGDLADDVVRRYRVSRADATTMILDEWRRRPDLVTAARSAAHVEDVRRLRVFREASVAAKKTIYNRLRRYRPEAEVASAADAALAALPVGARGAELAGDPEAVAVGHTSTAERLPHLERFLEVLGAMLGDAGPVLDLGSGVLPAVLPTGDGHLVGSQYWALDRDRAAVDTLQDYARVRADRWLHPMRWDLTDGWRTAHEAGLPARCDAALVLKVVPVVARRTPALLDVVATAPADRLVVSGSRVAMAKRQDIERRESRLLERFFADHDLVPRERVTTPDEILYLVTRGG